MGFMAAAAPFLGAAGAGISAIGAITGGEANAAEARYQAQVARNNQVIAEQNANYATAAGAEQTYATGLREREAAGRTVANIAANNIDVNTGSAAKVRQSQAEMGQLATETTAQSGELTAYGYRTQATGYGAQSQLYAAEAPRDITAGVLGAGGALLGGASNISFKWAGLQTPAVAGP